MSRRRGYKRYSAEFKREALKRARFRTRDEVWAAVFDYIECFYNRKRRHGHLDYLTPQEFENQTVGLS